jgi:EF-hand domain-containing protein 1
LLSFRSAIQHAQQGLQHKTPSSDDKLRRFLEFSGMVLTFDCMLDETDRPGGELISFKLYYYLEDDSVAIKELPENQQGRDGFAMLLKRTKLPKNWQKKPADVFKVSDADVDEFYQSLDFMIGATIFVFGRKFLLLDCDSFTRTYFDQVLRSPQPNKLEIQKPTCPEIRIVSFRLCRRPFQCSR